MNEKILNRHMIAAVLAGVFGLAVCISGSLFFISFWQATPAEPKGIKVESKISAQDWAVFLPPRVVNVTPTAGAENVLVAIEDPIRVQFASSVKPFFIRFDLDPEGEVLYENNSEKTEFKLLPKNPLQDGKRYTLRLSYKLREAPDSEFKSFYETSFTTISYTLGQNKDTEERLRQARAYTKAKRIEGKYIDINLKNQIMVLFENGRPIKSFLVSSGKPGMDTPQGEFSIQNKAPRPWSKAYSLYMPYWIAIVPDGKVGIHELPEWPGGYKEGANHLGRPVSHGCIRLGVGPAEEVYNWADIGTVVVVN